MERKNYLRLSGIIFIIGAVLGLFISVGGLIVSWANKANVTEQVTGTVSLVGGALSATHELIITSGTTLDEAATDLDLVHKMILDVSATLDDSSVMVSSTADLIGSNMVGFVDNTMTSLASVENSARAVDSILKKINSIPLLGPWLGNGYDPELPLQASVANVSRSLTPLPSALTQIRRDLDVSSANIATIKAEIDILAKQVDAIQNSLADARSVVNQYDKILSDMQTRFDAFEKRLPGWINTFYIVLTVFLVWIFITQTGMLIHGLTLFEQAPPA